MGNAYMTGEAWGTSDTQRAAAEGLARGVNLADVLKSRHVIDLMELPEVPRNRLLVKGVLESGSGVIPLMDLRVNFAAASPTGSESACALILNVGGDEIGVIVDRAPEA